MDRKRLSGPGSLGPIFACALIGVSTTIALEIFDAAAHAQAEDSVSDDDRRDQAVMERFLGLLEKNPRRGTALDRVYGYHVERGTLDPLLRKFEDRTKTNPKDGAAWTILGLMESQRGHDAASVTALRKAEEARPDDPLPSYYLGQALVLVGQPDAAAEAFERALSRKPARGDMLEIYQALGRVHQRAQHPEKALAVWARLEKLFPDDLRVQEQIAAALAEESQPEEALKRYEVLAKKAKDPYQQVLMRIESAELKVKINRSADALKDFEELLSRLEPASWLSKEVRRKIEEVFTRNDDLAGLAKYYESWVKQHNEDVEAMARLGRALAGLGRVNEAKGWFDKALKLAPSRRELRQALIEQLVQEGKFADAGAQYELMAKADPNNPDSLREWGRMLLRDTTKPEAERKKAAAAIWKRLVDARPDDATTASQIADLFRQAEMTEEAIDLYKKAISLAPKAAQYYEYLGEYYHTLKRTREALTTWTAIASGSNRTAKNLARLAEVLAGFGYKTEALANIAAACELQADDFDLRMKYADLLEQLERYPEALKQLEIAAGVAEGEEQASAVLEAQIKVFAASGTLATQIDELRKGLNAGQDATAVRWRRLARYLEADSKAPEATAAINKAMALDPKSVPGWILAARLHESSGDLAGATAALRKLAVLDRRNRAEYLTTVAQLEARMGRRDEALQAGRDVLAAAPGNPEHYQFFAELCFGLGETDQGLDALRRSVRLNPAEPKILLGLAEALAGQFRTEEAIELYWRAFEKGADLDAKLAVIVKLTELHIQRNQFDRLVARLEREEREGDRQREMAICLAAAYQASGDFGTARQALERLVANNARDTVLLQQLSSLAEREGDLATAAKYQQQMIDTVWSDEGAVRLAQLLAGAGEVTEAEAIWAKLAASDPSPHRTLQALDSLLSSGKYSAALRITEKMLRKHPDDWEARYRQGVALAETDKPVEAAQQFRAVLALNVDDDTDAEQIKVRKKAPNARPPGVQPVSRVSVAQVPMQARIDARWQIRQAARLDGRGVSNAIGGVHRPIWVPPDFGQARMAALAWLLGMAQKATQHEQFVQSFREAAAKAKAPDVRSIRDLYYLQTIRQDGREAYDAARMLARALPSDVRAQWTYLNTLVSRASTSGLLPYQQPGTNAAPDRTPGLPEAELNAILASFRVVKALKPEWIQWQILTAVATELKRANQTDLEDRFYRDAVAAASTTDAVGSVLIFSASRGNVVELLSLFDRYTRLRKGKSPTLYNIGSSGANALGQAMAARAQSKAHVDVLRILDHYLAFVRRDRSAPGATARAAAQATSTGLPPNYLRISVGKLITNVPLDFPSPNSYFDLGAIQLLRNAYEIYKRDDLLSDLFSHVRVQAENSELAESERVQASLAMAYLHWWNDEKDEAVAWHSRAGASSKNDAEVLLEQTEMRERRGEAEQGLALLDAIEPLDQTTMQRRETLALRLSVINGNVARARQAAERLFGLRLDSDTQIALASQMHQLGMHDLGEAVLARARRRAGNRTGSLVALMQQYQSQSKTDMAVQVAHQILRKPSPSFQLQTAASSNPREDENARQMAIQTLARSGRLKELIARAEAQHRASPKSIAIDQILLDYYRADGQKAKIRELYEQMSALRPDDARLQTHIANELTQVGEAETAIKLYRAAIKKDASLFGTQYGQVRNAFQRANKFDELVSLAEEIDLTALTDSNNISQLAQTLIQDPEKRERGLALFRRAWKAFPTQRQTLIATIQGDAITKLPELYEYARDAVIPAAGTARLKPWVNVEERLWANPNDGRLTSTVTMLLDIAARQRKLDTLEQELTKAVEAQPEWSGGKAILVIVQAKRGKTAVAKASLRRLQDESKNTMPADARWITAQLLEDIPAMWDAVVRLYEDALANPQTSQRYYSDDVFNESPLRRLFTLYQRSGRTEDAHALLTRFVNQPDDSATDDFWATQRRVNKAVQVGQRFFELGYPADAIRLYNAILSDESTLLMARTYEDDVSPLLREGMKQGLDGLNRENLPRTLSALLEPPANPKVPYATDIVLMIQPRELSKGTVISLLGTALKSAEDSPNLLTEARTTLRKRLEEWPKDISTLVAFALLALTEEKPDEIRTAVARLVQVVEETPLETLPANIRANVRQRTEAMPHIGVWLIARECSKREPLYAFAEKLTARAVDAARRQTDQSWSMAILREQANLALEQGDRAGAETAWGQMIDRVFSTNAKVTKPQPAQASTGSTSIKPASGAAAPNRPTILPTTRERFGQGMELAVFAARRGGHVTSLRAVTQSLSGGPPLDDNVPNNRARTTVVMSSGANLQLDAQLSLVEQKLYELDGYWVRDRVPARDVYETLRSVVLPDGRPAEIFLYARPLSFSDGTQPWRYELSSPRSVGGLLARWAQRAGKADDLRERIQARKTQPMAELPAEILLALLAQSGDDPAPTIKALEALGSRLVKDSQPVTAELACHVALPALTTKATMKPAIAVITAAARNMGKQSEYTIEPSLLMVLARTYFEAGDAVKGCKAVEDYLSAVDRGLVRTNRNGAAFDMLKRPQRDKAVLELSRFGQWNQALEILGQVADLVPNARAQYNNNMFFDQTLIVNLAAMGSHISTLPASERYDVLKAWTIPGGDHKDCRLLARFAARERTPPAAFAKTIATTRASDVVSTADWLIDAARDAGQLDALAAEIQKTIDAKGPAKVHTNQPEASIKGQANEKVETPTAQLENSFTLKLLVELARGNGLKCRPELERRLAELQKVSSTDGMGRLGLRSVSWHEYLVARACLADPATRDFGEKMARRMIESDPARALVYFDASFLQHLRRDLAATEILSAGRTEHALSHDPGLAFWHSNQIPPKATHRLAGAWAEYEGHIAHVPDPALLSTLNRQNAEGFEAPSLLFDIPLAGRFEFSADVFIDAEHGGGIGYGGLVIEPSASAPTQQWNNANMRQTYPSSAMWFAGKQTLVNHEPRYIAKDMFNRLTIQVEPGKVRYSINGHLYYEDDNPSPTSPWLMLASNAELPSSFRNVTVAGAPTVLHEVKLSEGDRLEGWRSAAGTMSPPDRAPRNSGAASMSARRNTSIDPENYAWYAQHGIIYGRAANPTFFPAVPGDSWLTYSRPLQDGDTVAYEFFYEPDAVAVDPVVGQMAFLLEPGGVRMHWLSRTAPFELGGLKADNVADEPANRRGPVTLKAGNWNKVALNVSGATLSLELNGIKVYEHPLEPDNDRLFGVYHNSARTVAQVRDVVLKGKWPESLTSAQLRRLVARHGREETSASREIRRAVVGEAMIGCDASEVLNRARQLPLAQRYELLRRWVLPDEARGEFRLDGDFAPANPANANLDQASMTGKAIRIQTGGDLIAPAIDLVNDAKLLGKLDDLAEEVKSAKANSERGRQAMLALIGGARDDAAATNQALRALQSQLAQIPAGDPERSRWPEFVAASQTIQRAGTRPQAASLLRTMDAEPTDEEKAKRPAPVRRINPYTEQVESTDGEFITRRWRTQVRHAIALASVLGENPTNTAEQFQDGSGAVYWSGVTHGTAVTRGLGFPRSRWSVHNGTWSHAPGHSHDGLYLNIPIRGDFEVTCELSAESKCEAQLVYGMLGVGVSASGKELKISERGKDLPDSLLDPPVKTENGWYVYRLDVRDGMVTVEIGGRKVHEQGLHDAPDPWLAIRAQGDHAGAVRNVKITGEPSVPESLELLSFPDLTGWLAYDAENTNGTGDDVRAWTKRGEEILGRLTTDAPGRSQESLLQYHRPLLENGEVMYEFYYDPGKAIVHPAIDRLVFILDPAGIKLHWRTDAQYERTGIAPENAHEEPAHRQGPAGVPLKPGAWNRAKLSLSRDTVTLYVNDVEIFQRPLEPTNQRFFGLFHYADATEARIRNVTYRGDWPRKLPANLGATRAAATEPKVTIPR